MRLSVGSVLLISSLLGSGALLAQTPAPSKTATVPAPTPQAAKAAPTPKCDNPNAMGLSRTVEIDTTGAPGFGFEHFKNHDFLKNGEVVLTFDDGPWPGTTPHVLDALRSECVKATFFVLGRNAIAHPDLVRRELSEGHTVAHHTWSHPLLNRTSLAAAQAEIDPRHRGGR